MANPRGTNELEIFKCFISPLVLNRTIDLYIKVRKLEGISKNQHVLIECLSEILEEILDNTREILDKSRTKNKQETKPRCFSHRWCSKFRLPALARTHPGPTLLL